MKENRLAIIPARGGSKRIPRKNVKDFLGKPIISYSIEAALSSKLFDEVMVSTDDDEIRDISIQCGAKVPFLRSSKNSDDLATTLDVVNEVVTEYNKHGRHFTVGCCIYPAAPFITPQRLRNAYELLISGHFDSVFPIIRFSSPVQRCLRLGEDNKVAMFYPQYIHSRAQDLESAFHDAGQFYWINIPTILEKQKLWTDNSGGIEIAETEGQDIDTIEDWAMAELKFGLIRQTS